ncbi:MAG: hypothetical protein ACRDBG_07560, partial [Waterburya sp.]
LEDKPSDKWERPIFKDEFYNSNYDRDERTNIPAVKRGTNINQEYINFRDQNPEITAFRNFAVGLYLDSQKHMDPKERLGLRVPAIERDLSIHETLQNRDIKKTIIQTKRRFTVTEQDGDEGLAAESATPDSAGKQKKFIPIRFRGRIPPEVQSRNMVETIGQFVAHSKRREMLSKLEPYAQAIQGVLSDDKNAPVTKKANSFARRIGIERHLKKEGDSYRLEQVRDQFNMFMYGQTDQADTRAWKWWSKMFSNLTAFKSLMTFSFEATGQGVNLLNGVFQQTIVSVLNSGEGTFSFKEVLAAYKTYIANTGGRIADTGKLIDKSYMTQLSEYFNFQGSYVDEFGRQLDSKGVLRNINTSLSLTIKNAVEDALAMTTMIAHLKSKKVKTQGGQIISLYDSFNIVDGTLKLRDDVLLTKEEVDATRQKLQDFQRKVNGNYAKLDKTKLETFVWGRALLFFKKYMAPLYMTRFGKKRYSLEEQSIEEGYISSSLKYFWEGSRNGIINLYKGETDNLHYFLFDQTRTPEQTRALKAFFLEIAIFSAVGLMIEHMLDYDDEDKNRFRKLEKDTVLNQNLVYILSKFRSEGLAFTAHGAVFSYDKFQKKLLNELIPYHKSMVRALKLGIFDEYEKDTGIHEKGDNKLAAEFFKVFGNFEYKFEPVQRLKDFEAGENR